MSSVESAVAKAGFTSRCSARSRRGRFSITRSPSASLAEIRGILQRPSPTIVVHMQKAVALEPSNPWHRIIAARVLARLNAPAEARKAAQSALRLADDDAAARKEAERILGKLAQR